MIKGMLFGDEDLYINASQHNLRNHRVSKCYGNVSNRREYTDYRITEGICTADGVFHQDRNANRTPHIDLNDPTDRGSNPGTKGNIFNANRRNEDIATDTILIL